MNAPQLAELPIMRKLLMLLIAVFLTLPAA
jgi:hypothetical protein